MTDLEDLPSRGGRGFSVRSPGPHRVTSRRVMHLRTSLIVLSKHVGDMINGIAQQ